MTEQVYDISPNRLGDIRVRTAVEEVANFVAQIPEMNVQFEGDTFKLATNSNAGYGQGPNQPNDASHELELELDTIAKNIEKYLKDCGFKKVKINPVEGGFDYNAIGSNTWRQSIMSVTKIYELTAEV
jgi:hypothetical protein